MLCKTAKNVVNKNVPKSVKFPCRVVVSLMKPVSFAIALVVAFVA